MSKKLVGRTAILRDIHCMPKQVGFCKIIAISSRGPDWVVVEWEHDGWYHAEGDVGCIELSKLELR